MTTNRLSPLQQQLLPLLAGLEPPWTLVGGGALCGFHLGHRETRDLDLFWQNIDRVDSLVDRIVRDLRASGLQVESLQTSPTFVQLRVADETEVVVLDLVADSAPLVEEPVARRLAGKHILVATMHEILVSKLCALLGRMELRDLIDVRALLEAGQDLGSAVRDAPKKDGGFSPLTLAWTLRGFPVARVGAKLGHEADEIAGLEAFRERLVETLLALTRP